VIDEINARLQLRIQPFKLTKREVLIDRLIFDPEVLKAAEAEAQEHGRRREEVQAEIRKYAREIVPSFNAYAYFRLGYWFARRFARLLYRVRLAYADEEGLAKVDRNASVVFIMNHRSNMDYILVAYLAATKSALSYAVGEWARIWPLQTLIKTLGAYFIRRKSGNPLYRKVLARYVHMATEGGVVQAVYPEGGLSKDGKLQPVKLGLLKYMVSSFNPAGERDILFIPVGINYDRVIEDRSLVRRLDPTSEKKSKGFVLSTTARFLLHNLKLILTRRWFKLGYAGVNFGTPISLKSYLADRSIDFRSMDDEKRFAEIEVLGKRLIDAVAGVIPVLPVSLVSMVLSRDVDNGFEAREYSELELKVAVGRLIRELEERGAHVYIPRKDREYAVTVGLRMLTLRKLIIREEGLYRANTSELPLIRYYANAIAHLLPASS
jgi:glycerol-3-phosphate O-acyltransferase